MATDKFPFTKALCAAWEVNPSEVSRREYLDKYIRPLVQIKNKCEKAGIPSIFPED